jgi:hypothetical protein
MALLGDWNWYLPHWLEWLPQLSHIAPVAPPTPTPPPQQRTPVRVATPR